MGRCFWSEQRNHKYFEARIQPFVFTPKSFEFRNNKSSLKNPEFVSEAITKLLQDGLVRESLTKPQVVSPLSVAENKGKKRLILDLRYVNTHLIKDKIKYDDWKCFENYLTENSEWLYNFDIKSGYHHIDIFEPHQTYLGFSWVIDGKTRYFTFTVLPFGLGSAPYIFTKIMRCLVKFWRGQGIAIAVYLDDGIEVDTEREKSLLNSKIVRGTLESSGFVVNEEKSILYPTKSLTWLGITVNLCSRSLFISNARIDSAFRFLT